MKSKSNKKKLKTMSKQLDKSSRLHAGQAKKLRQIVSDKGNDRRRSDRRLASSTEVYGPALMEDLRKWVQQKWVDIGAPKKGGGYKPCGRSKGEKRKGYPKCVPAAKAASMSKSQKRSAVKRKRAAGNPGGKPTMVSTFKKRKKKRESLESLGNVLLEKLCPKGKAAAKRKFAVYPSAYANMYASAVCSGKVKPGGKKKKKKKGKKK